MGFELVIRGATVYPGDRPPLQADVAVEDGRVAAVGPELEGGEILEAQELMLCPGFIDLHAHSALRPFEEPLLEPKLAQGFTTEVINPDGLAPAPVAEEGRERRRAYLRPLEGP